MRPAKKSRATSSGDTAGYTMWQFGPRATPSKRHNLRSTRACAQGYRPPGRDMSAPTRDYQVWRSDPSNPEDGMWLSLDNIDEASLTARLWHWRISTRLWTWVELSTVTNSKASRADLRSARGCLVQNNLGSLRHAFPQNLSDGFECIVVRALDETHDLRKLRSANSSSFNAYAWHRRPAI